IQRFVVCGMSLAFPLIFLFLLFKPIVTTLRSFSEHTVLTFIENAAKTNISEKCAKSLQMVGPFLSAYDTIVDQKEFLISSYSVGMTNAVDGRDQFRWAHMMSRCQAVAAERSYSISENPTEYCVGRSANKDDPNTYGVCLPQPCHNDRYRLLEEWISLVRNSSHTKEAETVICQRSRKEKEWECGQPSTIKQIFLAYSLKKNGKKLVALPKDANATITCMFGIRFFSIAWVVAGHSFIMAQEFLGNVTSYQIHGSQFPNQWMSNGTVCVDTFFLLGAILTSFIFFRGYAFRDKNISWRSFKFWTMFVVQRALRLWPAYIMAMSNLSMRWSFTLTSEPWPSFDIFKHCSQDWWKNLLFLNSILYTKCMPWTWYISADFMYNLMAPIYLLALKRSVLFGSILCVATILASTALNISTMITHKFAPVFLPFREPPPQFNDSFQQQLELTYIHPTYRIGPYLVGLLLGYHLARISVGLCKYVPSKSTFLVGTTCATVIAFFSVYGSYPLMMGWDWPIYYLIYGGFYRTIWSICVAWLIYFCYLRRNSIINRFLSCRFFIPLSNLCYSVYLMHAFGVMARYTMLPFPLTYAGYGLLWDCFVQLLFSYFIAIFTLFIAEYPCVHLIRLICKRIN
uniref:Acyltransferase 3 domain-containing protein n=1 Tax=Parascaris univalens TaxID=6257 RepID=A0A914ZMG1_PARUN